MRTRTLQRLRGLSGGMPLQMINGLVIGMSLRNSLKPMPSHLVMRISICNALCDRYEYLGRLFSQRAQSAATAISDPAASVPKSHVGLGSEGLLNSWPNSVLQRTRPAPSCLALRGYPVASSTMPSLCVIGCGPVHAAALPTD